MRKIDSECVSVERQKLLDDLHSKYCHGNRRWQRWAYLRKKYSWLFVIQGTLFLKRSLDIILSIALLAALSPLMLLVALLIKLTDRGPLFYVTDRVGRWSKPFRFPKFRSMVSNANRMKAEGDDLNHHDTGVTFKARNDPRVTWIGRIIRKTSIDELPQLWCVLKGEMSLVGPRPPVPDEVEKYTQGDRRRLEVRPGITCFWQVSGRADIPFSKQVEIDLQYIESQGILMDLWVLLKTIPAVLTGKGAY